MLYNVSRLYRRGKERYELLLLGKLGLFYNLTYLCVLFVVIAVQSALLASVNLFNRFFVPFCQCDFLANKLDFRCMWAPSGPPAYHQLKALVLPFRRRIIIQLHGWSNATTEAARFTSPSTSQLSRISGDRCSIPVLDRCHLRNPYLYNKIFTRHVYCTII